MARSFVIKIEIEGVDQTLRKFKALPKDANNRLRDKAKAIAGDLAVLAQAAARAEGHQAALVASTIKAQRDRVPVVVAGGMKRVGSRKVPAYKVVFGSEFGAFKYRQFKEHRGAQGYWFFPLIEEQAPMISKQFSAAADEAVREFVRGG